MNKGKLIVLEGLDGSGKATQAKLLAAHLKEQGFSVREITFPNYESDSSALVKMYLAGQFGQHPDDVNAYAASSFYAVDRYASYKKDWGSFYENGGIIIADRYTTSNAVHQCSKLPPEQWESFLGWLFDFEFHLLGLPAPDEVIYLQVRPRREPEAYDPALPRRREQEGCAREGYRVSCPQPLRRRVLCRAPWLGRRALHQRGQHAQHRRHSG